MQMNRTAGWRRNDCFLGYRMSCPRLRNIEKAREEKENMNTSGKFHWKQEHA